MVKRWHKRPTYQYLKETPSFQPFQNKGVNWSFGSSPPLSGVKEGVIPSLVASAIEEAVWARREVAFPGRPCKWEYVSRMWVQISVFLSSSPYYSNCAPTQLATPTISITYLSVDTGDLRGTMIFLRSSSNIRRGMANAIKKIPTAEKLNLQTPKACKKEESGILSVCSHTNWCSRVASTLGDCSDSIPPTLIGLKLVVVLGDRHRTLLA